MADDEMPPPIRLMNFVSEDQLEESRRTRGVRVEDGTAQRDRSLYEILQENKDKKDAEFKERFKHRPPKALDEDETEFLDKLEMTRKEYEQQIMDEEALQLRSFQAAVAAQSNTVNELKEAPQISKGQEIKVLRRKKPASSLLTGMVIKLKPQTKKAKVGPANTDKTPYVAKETQEYVHVSGVKNIESVRSMKEHKCDGAETRVVSNGLVSYSDESEEEE